MTSSLFASSHDESFVVVGVMTSQDNGNNVGVPDTQSVVRCVLDTCTKKSQATSNDALTNAFTCKWLLTTCVRLQSVCVGR